MCDRLNVFKDFTLGLASLSKCRERHVAAVITDKDLTQVYSIGINGGPKGLHDCLCVTPGKYGCIHAEINALVKCSSEEPDKIMIVSLAPCKQCAASIINAPGGFSKVYYLEPWKDQEGLQLLKLKGVEVKCLSSP